MLQALEGGVGTEREAKAQDRLACLRALEHKVLWLSTWMIHNANHLRPSRDGLKVGGHQASSASVATLMTALYFDVLRPQDRVAVKPHASPVFHAIQYLLGRQTRDKLERFRGFGGAQSYPSRTKDGETVDFSTGSVGLGVGMTLFASIAQDYLRLKRLVPTHDPPGRMIALAGDAELDEGNIFEALLEGWKHDVRNLWWVIDYNRQSLDAVVSDRLFGRIDALFEMMGWRVVTLKYGKRLQAAEGFWERQSASPAPYLWIIVPDQAHQRNLVQLGTPHLGSIWLTHSLHGRVEGLTNTPVDQQPMMAPVFYGFRTMYVIAMAMFALAVVSLWLRWHGRLYSTRWFLRALVWMTPSGFVATLAGWYTAEIGRQPYLIHGLLRTADSLSPVPAATTLVTFVCAYTVFGSAFLIFTLRLIRRGPSGLPGYALPAGSLKRALRPVIGGVREHLPSRE